MAKKMGAVLDEDRTGVIGSDTYVIETKAGPMTIHPSTTPRLGKQDAVFTVFCKFEDVDRSKALGLPHCNPYSGKYNFHECGHDSDIDSALDEFRQHLKLAMPQDL